LALAFASAVVVASFVYHSRSKSAVTFAGVPHLRDGIIVAKVGTTTARYRVPHSSRPHRDGWEDTPLPACAVAVVVAVAFAFSLAVAFALALAVACKGPKARPILGRIDI
jgi:hypothetical protein